MASDRLNAIKKRLSEQGVQNTTEQKEQDKSSYGSNKRIDKIREELNSNGFSTSMTVDDVDDFMYDAQSFIERSTSAYSNLTWEQATSEDYKSKRNETSADLTARAGKVRTFLNANKGSLDPDVYENYMQYLNDFAKFQNQSTQNFENAYRSYSEFETQEDYDKALSASKQMIEWEQKYAGMSHAELKDAISKLEDGAEKEWLASYTTSQMTHQDYTMDIEIAEWDLYRMEIELEEFDYLSRWELTEEEKVREDRYRNKYGTVQDLKRLIEEKKEYIWGLEKGQKYNLLSENEDYAYQSTKVADEPTAGWGVSAWGKWYGQGDEIYDYVNDIDGSRERIRIGGDKNNGDAMYYHLSFMSEDEISKYNYLYNTSGRDAANEYLDYLKYDLNKRRQAKIAADHQKFAIEHPDRANLYSIGATLASGIGLIDIARQNAVKGIKEAVTGEYAGPIDYHTLAMNPNTISTSIRYTRAQTLANKYGVININEDDHPLLASIFNGKSLGDVYQLGMSMADSAAVLAMSPFIGPYGVVLLGGSAGTQGVLNALENGATDEQALAMGTLNGFFEMFFEKYSLETLLSSGGRKFADALWRQAVAEGSEEFFTSAANNISDILIMAEKSGYMKKVAKYIDDGLSDREAMTKALTEMGIDMGWDFVGGLISGGIMGGGGHIATKAVQQVQQSQYYKDYKSGQTIKNVDGGVEALKKLANDVAGVTSADMQDTLGKQVDKVTKKATNTRVGKLYNAVQVANNQANASANQADITKSLMRNNFSSEQANAIAEALVASYNGQQLTNEQSKLLKSVQNNAAVKNAISNIIDNTQSTMGQRSQNIRDFQYGVYKGMINNAVKEIVRKDTTDKQFTPTGEYEVTDTGKAVNTETNEEIEIKGVASIRNGKLLLDIGDGNTVNANSVSFASASDALIYESIAKLGDNISAETANKLIAKYDGSNAEAFARGIAQAYTYGFHGIDISELKDKNVLATKLTQAQKYAYELGKQYRPVKDQADKALARARKAPGEKGVYYRDKNGNATDIRSYLEQDGRVLNEMQTTGIEFMEKMSKMMGVRFNVFETWVENGKRYYLDENGKKTEGNPNGFYDPKTGEIYIDLFAGNDYQGTMLFTVAHELTHFMRQWSPEHFTKISKIVFSHAGFKGSVSSLVADKMNTKRKLSYDAALEEVVADGMETILKDGKVAEFMVDVKKTDSKLWAKLKEWFQNFAEFLKKMVNAYSGQSAQTEEGQKVADFSKKLLNQIEQIWAEGAVAAGENYQAAVDGYKAEQEQFSTDSIRGNSDGAVVQNESTEAFTREDSMHSWRTEYEAFPKQTMSLSDGSGTIMGSIEGLVPTEIKGLADRVINGYTGRAVRGYAMGISGFTKAQISEVNKFMDTMADFMKEAGVTYRFIGLQDVENAQLHYTYNADGSIKSIVLSAMVKNGDYPVNFDLSSICKKRVAMSKLIDKLARRGSLDSGTVKLTPSNIFKINTALKDAGYETACLGCFVESKRYNSLEWANKFCNKWNAAVKKVNPNATYFGYGDASFNEDSFTLEQAVKIDEAATKYITATKTERLANALAKYKAREQEGLPLVAGKVMNVDGVELNTFSKAARERLAKSDTISDELKTKYLTCDVAALNIADVEFLLENGILPGAALTNKQAVTEMVKSGEAYQHLLRPSDLLTDRGISKLEALPNFHGVLYGHYGSGTPKLMQSYTPYNSEIALLPSSKGDQSLAEYLYSIAGVRMQSFSDFQIQNIYDYLQMVGDLAARNVPAHAYTKEISFAKLLGMTGIKVNLSVMFDIDPMVDKAHAGLTKLNKLVHRGEYAKVVLEDEHGKWVYNIGDYQTQKLFAEAYPDSAKRFLQSIGFADAVKLQSAPGYSSNCGIIGVGYSDLGIFAMLNDNRIRYIIPYHASSLPADIKLATHIALGTDYTPYQNNMKIKEIVDRNGNKVNWTIKEAYKRLGSGQAVINELNEKIRTEGWVVSTSKAQTGHGTYKLYEDLQQTNDPRKTASNFMDWCIGNSTLPLFYQFASHENYYKLIYDYNVYDCVTEEYAPQQAVTNTYPTMVDGQVQPGNVTDGGFDAEYFKGIIDKQMAFMNEYSRNLDEDLEQMADNLESGTMFSFRGENKDGIEVYETSEATMNLTWAERVSQYEKMLSTDFVGRTARFERNGHIYYAQFDPGSAGKVLYGEKGMSKAGKKAIIRAGSDGDIFDLVENARYDHSAKDTKNHKAKDGFTDYFDYFYKTVQIDGKVFDISINVKKQYGSKHGFTYTIKVADNKTMKASPALADNQPSKVQGTPSSTKIAQHDPEVKKFSDRDTAPTFYSHMARVVDAVKQEKLGAASVVSMLRGKGVKAEEIKWSGIEAWLDGKKSVTKAELQEFIAGSMLQIEEATLDGKHQANVEVKKLSKKEYAVLVDGKQVDTLNKVRDGLFSAVIESSNTGEIFDSTDDAVSAYKRKNRHRPKHSAFTLDGGTNYRELLFKLPGSEYSNHAMEVHWGKDAHGILAHARMQDMNTFLGKMLFIEEIQSDWHNEGHAKGYESLTEKGAGIVPDAPFKNTYHEYVMKRLLREAAEQDYDSIGWTTAQTQVERWSEDFAEGYRIEYDQDIPKFLNKYGKKWGTKVGKTVLDNGTEVWSMAITDSMKESVLTEGQALYQDRAEDSISNRSLLANAFEGIAKPEEMKLVAEYKANLEKANDAQARLNALNAKIKELSFSKGPRDTNKINELRKTAKDVADLVSKYDKKLLKIEAAQPLQDVLAREKKIAYAKAAQRHNEALAEYKAKVEAKQKETAEKWRESRKAAVAKAREAAKRNTEKLKESHKASAEKAREEAKKTAMRQKIRKIIRELDKVLNRGNKKQNVKEDMRGFVASAIASAEVLFTDNYTNEDMIRNGIGTTVTPEEQRYLDEARKILAEISNLPSGSYEAMLARQDTEVKLKSQLSYRMTKLKDVFLRERIRLNEAEVSSVLGSLADEYAGLKNSEYEYVKVAFSENVYNYIKFVQEDIGGTKIRDMSLSQLESLYKAYTMVMTAVRNANKAFVASKNVDQLVEDLVTEFGGKKIPKNKVGTIARNIANMTGWDYEKLYYALDRIGSDTFTELFINLANSENIVMADVIEAKQAQSAIIKKYKYNTWKVDQKIDKDFVDNTGKVFHLTLGELMSLYAYSRREGAWNHIEYGGFVFGKASLTDVDPVTAYKLTKDQCEAITSTLTEEQKNFTHEMQAYLSDVMGAKGNEVSMLLYGIEMFGEKNYFPIHIAGQFMARAQESQAKSEAGFASMTNAGFTQAQNKKAKAPFVMESFMDVWVDHVNEMSRYHGAVPALEDIRKVMNYSYYSESNQDSMSVQSVMENKFGKQAVQYFNDLYKEANSGAITDKLQKTSHKLLSKFRKNSVAYSLSVLVQQPASIVRAYAMIPMKYFRGLGVGALPIGITQAATSKWTKSYNATYAKMMKYAPGVTLAKEIGGFDTASGNSVRTYLMDTDKRFKQKWKTENALGKANAIYDLVDDNPIANLPNVADKIAWIEIWNACENETKATHKELAPNSDLFYEHVGNRFTEVIRATQVYDSIFSKSPMLKSKSLAVQYLVSFMNEPNTTVNMAKSALIAAIRGDGKKATRLASSVVGAVVFTCVLKSVIYALRDDDEDENYIEKYTESLVGNLLGDITVFNYIPVARDVWSLAQGYDVERPDMAIVADAVSALTNVVSNISKDTSDMTEDELEEWDKKVTEANWKLADSVCATFGIPLKNVRREIDAILDTARIAYKNSGKMSWSWIGIKDAVIQGIADASPVFAKPDTMSNSDNLYAAIVKGDKTYEQRIKDSYVDDKGEFDKTAYSAAIRKGLRDNDPRIKEAAKARFKGDHDKANKLLDEIAAEGFFSRKDISAAIKAEYNKLKDK